VNEKAIAISAFFISIFLLYQIRFIVRLRKLKKKRENLTEKDFILGAYYNVCGCCCDSMCIMSELGCNCFDAYYSSETAKKQREKKAERQSDEVERRTAEKRKIEKKEYIALIELEKIDRPERVEVLRASGYTANERDRNKVLDIVSINPKTGLPWTSTTARIPIEEVVLIIESEPDFEIKDEYIINKKKLLLEKEKKIAAENICPICNNQFELGSDFCPNCGYEL